MKLFFLTGLFASALSLHAAPITGSSSLTVREVDGKQVIEKVETRFFEDPWYKKQLFKFVGTTVSYVEADGADQSGVITAYKTVNSLFDTEAWTKNVKGADFSIFNDEFVKVSEFGCCDSPTINRLYNRETGQQVEAATNETTLIFEVPNTSLSRRYLAIVVDSRAPAMRGTKTYIGTVSYFDSQRILSRARIYGQLDENGGAQLYDTGPVLIGRNEAQQNIIQIWESDGVKDAKQAFSKIGLKGATYLSTTDVKFEIIITNDTIDAAASHADAGLEIVPVP